MARMKPGRRPTVFRASISTLECEDMVGLRVFVEYIVQISRMKALSYAKNNEGNNSSATERSLFKPACILHLKSFTSLLCSETVPRPS